MLHRPLSQSLGEILDELERTPQELTLNFLIERTHKRGLYLLLVLLSLPFITPVPLPGLSNVLGIVIVILALRMAFQLPPYLPRFIGTRTLPPDRMKKVLRNSVKFLTYMEKWVKPRRTDWLSWRAAQVGNALLVAFMALVLALPIPPVIPFSNALPSYSIIVLAVSMMEEDGFMIWLGYVLSILTVFYIVSTAGVILRFFLKYYDLIIEFFRTQFS